MILKHPLTFILTATLALGTFTACSNDDPAPMRPNLPATTGKAVRSISRLGSIESGYDWTFTYNDGRLTQAAGTLRKPSADTDRTFSYTSTLSYGPTSVKMTNTSGERVGLQLNMQGLVGQMTVNRNVYHFQYNSDGRMVSWTRTIFESSLGELTEYRSSATISYTPAGALQQIVYNGTDNRRVLLTFTQSAQQNVNGHMPPTVSKEMGIDGFEHLYYAGLLGKAPTILPQSITYEYPDAAVPTAATTTTFEYGVHANNVTLCNYHVASGAVASVSYGY